MTITELQEKNKTLGTMTREEREQFMGELLQAADKESWSRLLETLNATQIDELSDLLEGIPVSKGLSRSTHVMRGYLELLEKIGTLNRSSQDVGVLSGYAGSTYSECLDEFDSEDEAAFEKNYKIPVSTVKTIIEMGVLPVQILDMIIHSLEVYSVDDFWS